MRQRVLQSLASLVLVGASLYPFARMLFIVLTVGENNLSNDYLPMVQLLIQLITHHFAIGDLGQTCLGWRCNTLMVYSIAFLAGISHWDVRLEMAVSIVIAAAACLLIYVTVTGADFRPRKLWLLCVISALTFSFTEISTFTFGATALYTTMAVFGLCLGLYSVIRRANSAQGIILLILGMWIAVWSYGAGLLAIPILFVGVLIAFRKARFFVPWALSLPLMALPYLQYYIYHRQAATQSGLSLHSLTRFDWIFQTLSYFFSNGLTSANPAKELVPAWIQQSSGYIGAALLIIALFFLFRYYGGRKTFLFYAELGLVAFGVGAIWQISIVRQGIAIWYVSDAAPFWIGLIGLYFAMISRSTEARPRSLTPVKLTFGILLALVAMLYINSNLQYQDKVAHLYSRAPASAACLRNYASAPTYCEGLLFQWGLGNPQQIFRLGRPLEAAGLSVFAPSREWSLQGDYILRSVAVTPSALGQNPVWIDDQGLPSSWSDYHRLNLALPVGASVDWSMDVPNNLVSGEFTTDVSLTGEPNTDPSTMHPIQAEVMISTIDNGTSILRQQMRVPVNFDHWLALRIPITSYAGSRIRISLASDAPARKKRLNVLFRYPELRLTVDPPSRTAADTYQPENVVPSVDPSKSISILAANPDGSLDQQQVSLTDLSVDFPQRLFSQAQGRGGKISLRPEQSLCVDDQTEFYLAEALDSSIVGRYAHVAFALSGPGTEQYYRSIFIPLLSDSALHTYLYPLRLLIDTSPAYISSVEITPISDSQATTYRIPDIGFVRAAAPAGGCP